MLDVNKDFSTTACPK